MPLVEWVERLLGTAAVLGNFAAPSAAPHVTRLSADELSQRVCAGACPARGAYVPGEGVLLLDTLEIDADPRDRSVLLHELVHYLQDKSDRFANEPECDRYVDREMEAYDIQDRYLERYNLGLRDQGDALQWLPASCSSPTGDDQAPIQLDGQQ